MPLTSSSTSHENLSFDQFRKEVLDDYRIAILSRECSILGRREVLTGRAKFGIFGDGKEIPQLAMAKAFKLGDFRSGYYRDQTFMMALGELMATRLGAAYLKSQGLPVQWVDARELLTSTNRSGGKRSSMTLSR